MSGQLMFISIEAYDLLQWTEESSEYVVISNNHHSNLGLVISRAKCSTSYESMVPLENQIRLYSIPEFWWTKCERRIVDETSGNLSAYLKINRYAINAYQSQKGGQKERSSKTVLNPLRHKIANC